MTFAILDAVKMALNLKMASVNWCLNEPKWRLCNYNKTIELKINLLN